jgi:hypothetical protein
LRNAFAAAGSFFWTNMCPMLFQTSSGLDGFMARTSLYAASASANCPAWEAFRALSKAAWSDSPSFWAAAAVFPAGWSLNSGISVGSPRLILVSMNWGANPSFEAVMR